MILDPVEHRKKKKSMSQGRGYPTALKEVNWLVADR